MSRRIDGWGDCQFPKKMHSISGCSAKELQQKQSLNKGASMRKIRRSKQFGCGRKNFGTLPDKLLSLIKQKLSKIS
jgi:hypothetical protein